MTKITSTQTKILASRIRSVMDAHNERQDTKARQANERTLAVAKKSMPKLISRFLRGYADALKVEYTISTHQNTEGNSWYNKPYLKDNEAAFVADFDLNKLTAQMEQWFHENAFRALGAPDMATKQRVECVSLGVAGEVPDFEADMWREAFRKIDAAFLTGDAAAIMKVIDQYIGAV
jgi:hypothetical protein